MLNIVGGTYLEQCVFPAWDEIYGSGLRAATALCDIGEVSLHTYVSGDYSNYVEELSTLNGFDLDYIKRRETISFHYLHGLSDPFIDPPIRKIGQLDPIKIDSKNILRFGMLEGEAIVDGERVVYDPQSPNHPIEFCQNGSRAEELALVLNKSEAIAMSGNRNVKAAGEILLQDAEVIIIKKGSKGASLFTDSEQRSIPAFETKSVWALGTGDVFSAVFSFYWADLRLDPYQAAYKASLAVSNYCETKILPVTNDVFDKRIYNPKKIKHKSFKNSNDSEFDVYLASPFFSLSEYWLLNETRNCLEENDLKVFSPIHNVGSGNSSEITEADLKGLKNSKVVFAIADGKDVGTIFEIGYARSEGIPVIVYSTLDLNHNSTMLEGSQCKIFSDFTTAIYKTVWEVNTE